MNRDVHKNLPIDEDGAAGWIETNTHNTFFYKRRNPENISIYDIAHGLAHLCRYSGQCNYFYSVAQHSCIIFDHAPTWMKMEGLMHDGAEAYISDIPRPVKTIVPEIKMLEEEIQTQIAERFRLRYPIPSQVKILDSKLMLREAQLLFDNGVRWTVDGLEPLNVDIKSFWSPQRSKREFLFRFEFMTGIKLLDGVINEIFRYYFKKKMNHKCLLQD